MNHLEGSITTITPITPGTLTAVLRDNGTTCPVIALATVITDTPDHTDAIRTAVRPVFLLHGALYTPEELHACGGPAIDLHHTPEATS